MWIDFIFYVKGFFYLFINPLRRHNFNRVLEFNINYKKRELIKN